MPGKTEVQNGAGDFVIAGRRIGFVGREATGIGAILVNAVGVGVVLVQASNRIIEARAAVTIVDRTRVRVVAICVSRAIADRTAQHGYHVSVI